MPDTKNDEQETAAASGESNSRRGFLSTGVGLLGTGMAAAVLGPAAALLAHPLGHSTTSGSDEFIPAGKRRAFSGDVPVKVDLYADKTDAWNRVVQVRVGAAWVRESGGELVALSTVCPHLGCGIDYDPVKAKFLCACHQSWFTLDGGVEEGPSPRAMDTLQVEVKEKLVQIRYERFKQGIEGKEPIV